MDKVKHIKVKEYRLFNKKIFETTETYEECFVEEVECLNPEMFKEIELKRKK